MRYTCKICGSWVKDKFIFGTLHFCLSPEVIQFKIQQEFIKRIKKEGGGTQEKNNRILKEVYTKYL